MQSGARLPLTLTHSPGEREQHSSAWEYSLNSEYFPALPTVLPLPEGEGWGEGEGRVLLSSYDLGGNAPTGASGYRGMKYAAQLCV